MNPKSQSGESARGESHLADELYKVISKAQLLYSKKRLICKRCTEGKIAQRFFLLHFVLLLLFTALAK